MVRAKRDYLQFFGVGSFQVDPQKRQSWYRNEALVSDTVKMQGLMLPQTGHVWLVWISPIVSSIAVLGLGTLLSECVVDVLPVCELRVRSDEAVFDCSVLEQHAGWDAEDVVFHG